MSGDQRTPDVRLVRADGPELVGRARKLFREYAGRLGFDLDFQDFERELASLPGDYAPPDGLLLLALDGDAAVGCVAARRFAPGVAEMKRLYVRPSSRGIGIGRRLARAAVDAGRAAGYRSMRLDTVPWMKEALRLYRSLGFRDIAPYRPNPIPGARFLELRLAD